jgi:hypothetical protein
MRAVIAAVAVALACLAVAGAHAQEVPTERSSRHTTGLWTGLYSKYRVSDQGFFHGEVHFRRRTWFVRDMS